MTDDRSERLRQRRKRSMRGASQRRDDRSTHSTDDPPQSATSSEWADAVPYPTVSLRTIRSTLLTTARRYRRERIPTERIETARLRRRLTSAGRWLAIDGDRRIVTLALLGLGVLVFGPVGGRLSIFPPELFAGQHGTGVLVSTLLVVSAILILFLTVLTIVSGLAALTLLRPDQQAPRRQQLSPSHSADQVRHRLADLVDSSDVPAELKPQLRLLAAELLDRAQRLEGTLATAGIDRPEDLDADVASLVEETRTLKQQFTEAETAFDVLRAAMKFDCDRQRAHLRDRRRKNGDANTADATTRIDDLLELLEHFATTRQAFKTQYTQRAFTILARDLMLIGIPALALLVPLLYSLHLVPTNHLLVAVVNLLVLAPVVLLGSYGLRVAGIWTCHQDWLRTE